jgi:hypothetical protein
MASGRSTPSITYGTGFVTADVPCLSDDETAFVARWEQRNTITRTLWQRRCLSVDGDLYLEVLNSVGRPLDGLPSVSGERLPDPSFGEAIFGTRTLEQGERAAANAAYSGQVKQLPKAARNAIDSNLESNRAVADEVIRSLVFADGQVWKKVPSVLIRVMRAPWDRGLMASIVGGQTGFDAPPTGIEAYLDHFHEITRYYGLGDIDRMARDCEGMDLTRDFRNVQASGAAVLEGFDTRGDFVMRSVRHVLARTVDKVGDLLPEPLEHWLAMRAAWDAHVAAPGEPVPPSAEEAFRAFVPFIDDDRLAPLVAYRLEFLDDLAARAPRRSANALAMRR